MLYPIILSSIQRKQIDNKSKRMDMTSANKIVAGGAGIA